jgi:ADP-ribosylglycohydrolase
MKGAIIGDIIGSAFIHENLKSTDFQLFRPTSAFTDDTVLTMATADSILNGTNYQTSITNWVKKYPNAGYRNTFLNWIRGNSTEPYISDGDGAARRISPIGFAAHNIEGALHEAEKATIITHNIPIKVEASKATAVSIFMAKNGATRKEIKSFISVHFGYDLTLKSEHWKQKIQKGDKLNTPVPAALSAFFEASDFEEAIRIAIYIGGPSNTIASIAGALAQAYFQHIPKAFIKRALARLTPDMENLIEDFEKKYLEPSEVL